MNYPENLLKGLSEMTNNLLPVCRMNILITKEEKKAKES